MSHMLLQCPFDQTLENSALEEIILQQRCSKTRSENIYTALVKNSNHFNKIIVPLWAEKEVTTMKDRMRKVWSSRRLKIESGLMNLARLLLVNGG